MKSSFREKVEQLLVDQGITKAELARKMTTSPQNITGILNQTNPNLSTLNRLADALSVDVTYFVNESSNDIMSEPSIQTMGDRLMMFLDSKNVNPYDLSDNLGIADQVFSNIRSGKSQPSANLLKAILTIFPDLNTDWILLGKGSMVRDLVSNSSYLIDIPEPGEEDELELIKTEDHTEFRRLGEDKYLVVAPLISQYAYAGYVSGWSDPEYIEDMPRHAVVMNELTLGIYRSMEVRGDSMDNGKKGCIGHGDIVTGRKLYQKHWRNKLHLHKYKYYIIVCAEGIVVKEILDHNVEEGKILCHSLNPDKETYPDYEISLDDVKEIYYIKAVTEPYN